MLTLRDIDIGSARSRLEMMAAEATADEDERFRALLPGAVAKARKAAKHWDFMAPVNEVRRLAFNDENFPASRDTPERERLERVLVARLALDHFEVEDKLPHSVTSLYGAFFERLAGSALHDGYQDFRDDFFAKDVRYSLGLTIPGGALQFDPWYRIGPKLLLRDWVFGKSPRATVAYLKSGAWGRWYRFHLDLRWMRDFHADGWNRFYCRMAEMLALNPDVLGIVSMAWFYDPLVAQITPNLAYVQDPIAHGAFRVHIGSDPQQVRNAIFRSLPRRELYEQGTYMPTSYLIAWPRNSLISWAKRLAAGPDPKIGTFQKPMDARASA
jgi:hypothetical protein